VTHSRTGLAKRLEQRPDPRPDHVMVLYRVVDTLIDGYFPVLADLDDRIDELEDAILQRPTNQQLGQLFDMKRSLIAMRKVITPQRDMFASLLYGTDALPGMTPDAERYFRDLYDHLLRISDLVDSYRDLMSGVLDTQQPVRHVLVYAAEVQPETGRGITQVLHGARADLMPSAIDRDQETIHAAIVSARPHIPGQLHRRNPGCDGKRDPLHDVRMRSALQVRARPPFRHEA
jgi:hypothetical protein